ncbi:MAG: hypothetical protein HA489_01715 [Archaeoglobales archaeon]|nr:hypothetical protein [Archaeoglobales archaeon]
MKFVKVLKLLLVASIAVFVIQSVSAVIPSPSIEIDPVNGNVGSSVSIKGKDFSIESEVRIFWEGKDKIMASTKTDSKGSFSASITVPQVPCGYYRIKAIDEVGFNAYSTFRVTPKITKISATKGSPGTVITISGNGFSADSDVEIRFLDPFNETWIISQKLIRSNDTGVIQANFEIPQTSEGEYRIYAVDSKTGLKTEYFKFTVTAPKTTPVPTTTTSNEQSNKTNQTTKPTTTASRVTPKTPVTFSPKSTPGFEFLLGVGGIAAAFLMSRRRR